MIPAVLKLWCVLVYASEKCGSLLSSKERFRGALTVIDHLKTGRVASWFLHFSALFEVLIEGYVRVKWKWQDGEGCVCMHSSLAFQLERRGCGRPIPVWGLDSVLYQCFTIRGDAESKLGSLCFSSFTSVRFLSDVVDTLQWDRGCMFVTLLWKKLKDFMVLKWQIWLIVSWT